MRLILTVLAVLLIFAVSRTSVLSPAQAQVGANTKNRNPGWVQGVYCYEVGSKGCARRIKRLGNGGKY
jgi:hypothetical protein